jgi:lipoprotein-releasing system ATP-binding protein
MPYLIKELTVLENVMSKGLIAGVDADACKQEALALLEQVGLSDKVHEHPPILSGGQQQRVALARALFGKPAFLLADEPTGNLDAKNGQAIIDLLLACKDAWGMGIIVSTHDPAVAQRMEVQLEMRDGLLL